MNSQVASSHKIILGMIAWIAVISLLSGLFLWKKPIEAAGDFSPTPAATLPAPQASATQPFEYRALLPIIHKDFPPVPATPVPDATSLVVPGILSLNPI